MRTLARVYRNAALEQIIVCMGASLNGSVFQANFIRRNKKLHDLSSEENSLWKNSRATAIGLVGNYEVYAAQCGDNQNSDLYESLVPILFIYYCP